MPPDESATARLARCLHQLWVDAGEPSSTRIKQLRTDAGFVLAPATLSEWRNGKSVPSEKNLDKFRELVVRLQKMAGQQQDRHALDRLRSAAAAERTKPGGRPQQSEKKPPRQGLLVVPVSTLMPDDIGVHVPRPVNGAPRLPAYVSRDHDPGLRAALELAACDGGLIVVHGESSVGKSRSLLEAVRDGLPDWQVALPRDARELRASAAGVDPRTVIWLDETPAVRFLAAGGLAAQDVRRIRRDVPGPVIVVVVLWSPDWRRITAPPPETPQGELPPPDPWHAGRSVLELAAATVFVNRQLSGAERRRAESLANTDERIKEGLADQQFGLTQSLGGVPYLVRWWDGARAADPLAWALVSAALDAPFFGVRRWFTAAVLEDAADGYLTPGQRARTEPGDLAAALDRASAALRGGCAPLIVVRERAGAPRLYAAADYLVQHARGAGFRDPLPAPSVLEALLSHVDDGRTARDVGWFCRRGFLFAWAYRFFRRAAELDNPDAGNELGDLLRRHFDRPEEAERWYRWAAERGCPEARWALNHHYGEALDTELDELDELLLEVDRGLPYRLGDSASYTDVRKWSAEHSWKSLLERFDSTFAERAGVAAGQVLATLWREFESGGWRDRPPPDFLTIRYVEFRAELGDLDAVYVTSVFVSGSDRERLLRKVVDEVLGAGHRELGRSAAEDLSELLAAEGRTDESLAVLEAILDERLAARHSELLIRAGRLREAERSLYHLAPRNSGATSLLCALLADQGRAEDRRRLLGRLAMGGDEWAFQALMSGVTDPVQRLAGLEPDGTPSIRCGDLTDPARR